MTLLTPKCGCCGKRRLALPFADMPAMLVFEAAGEYTRVCWKCLEALGKMKSREEADEMLERIESHGKNL